MGAKGPDALGILVASLAVMWHRRSIIAKLTMREIASRYRGSIIGVGWSFLQPLLMLGMYTFVFSVVFKARWATQGDGGSAGLSILLFVGIIIHGFFAECVSRAPGLIVNNVNFVKKVVFPVEVLPVVALLAALFNAGISVCVLLAGMLLTGYSLHATMLLLPVVFLPLMVMTLGVAWFLAAIGVFIRDIGQVVGLVVSMLLFLSPVFYPVSSLPEAIRGVVFLNPLTLPIEQARDVLIFGNLPSAWHLAIYSLISVFVMASGFLIFQKLRSGFADVV